jgi:hypothetical protein
MSISYKRLWQDTTDRLVIARDEANRLRGVIAGMQERADTLENEISRLNGLLAAHPETQAALAWRRATQVVDLAGIARHMRVSRATPGQWQQRKFLPPSDFPEIESGPLWYTTTIVEKFVNATGRVWWHDDEINEALPPAA